MAMTAAERRQALRRMAADIFVVKGGTATLSTTDLDNLIEDLDSYLDANAAAINSAIRVGVRAKATAGQKAFAMAYCAMKRSGVF